MRSAKAARGAARPVARCLAALVLALVPALLGAPAAQAHNKTSIVTVSVSAAGASGAPDGAAARVEAVVSYADGDPVLAEDVVGVLWSTASGRTRTLALEAVPGRAGVYASDVEVTRGRHVLRVAAVSLTRGDQTAAFTWTGSAVADAVSPAGEALPASAQLPTTLRARLGAALRLVLLVVVVVAGAVAFRLHRTDGGMAGLPADLEQRIAAAPER